MAIIEVRDRGLERWELIKPILHYTKEGELLYIPKGFVTDFATVPPALRWFFPPLADDKLAFIVHDYLYTIGRTEEDRREADLEMQHVQRSLGASVLRYTLMFWGVRIFGRPYFKKKG